MKKKIEKCSRSSSINGNQKGNQKLKKKTARNSLSYRQELTQKNKKMSGIGKS